MANAYLLRVFTDANGRFGDKVSVVIDEGRHIPDAERQALTRRLKTVETAFVNSRADASISIMHTQGEIDFARVPALGTAWLLTKLSGSPITGMRGRGGTIVVSKSGEFTWVRANLKTMPSWNLKRLDSAEAVEHITLEETGAWQHTMVWAWINEPDGLIRARTFTADWDIPEAQGNGSGSMMLAAAVNRDIEIKHGEGSVIFARPAAKGNADIGGRVMEEQNFRV